MENPSWFTADVDPDGSQHKKKLGERPGEPSQLVSRKEVILGNTVWKMLSVDLKSQFIGIFSLGPSILFYFFRGSTPPATDEGSEVSNGAIFKPPTISSEVVIIWGETWAQRKATLWTFQPRF